MPEHPLKFKVSGVGISHYFGDLVTNSPDSVIVLIQRSSFKSKHVTLHRLRKMTNLSPNSFLRKETPHGSPPDYHATRRDACLAWGCALPCLPGFERSAPRAIGGSQSLQTSSSVRTTNRTSVFRRRHLYRTFSKKRNIRLVRST